MQKQSMRKPTRPASFKLGKIARKFITLVVVQLNYHTNRLPVITISISVCVCMFMSRDFPMTPEEGFRGIIESYI